MTGEVKTGGRVNDGSGTNVLNSGFNYVVKSEGCVCVCVCAWGEGGLNGRWIDELVDEWMDDLTDGSRVKRTVFSLTVRLYYVGVAGLQRLLQQVHCLRCRSF